MHFLHTAPTVSVVAPGKVVEFSVLGKRGWLAIDTLVLGRYWGWVRIHPWVSRLDFSETTRHVEAFIPERQQSEIDCYQMHPVQEFL